MRKTSPGVLIAAVVTGLVLLALGGYLALVAPQSSRAARLDERIDETQRQIDANRSAARGGEEVRALSVGDGFRLAKAMPDRTDMTGILIELSRLAGGTGVVFQSITPSPAVTGTGYSIVPISVVFGGRFGELTEFLARLRELVRVSNGRLHAYGRLFTVESLNFAQGTDKLPRIQATLTLDAYVYGPGQGAADATGTTTTTTTTPPPPSGATAAGAP